MSQDIPTSYKILALFLFALLALPTAAVVLVPNDITKTLYFPLSIPLTSIHEVGHIVMGLIMGFLPVSAESANFPVASGGTLFQIGVPLLVFLYSVLVTKRHALSYVMLVWLAFSIYVAGQYMSTALNPYGTAITASGEVVRLENNLESNDWRIMLGDMGILQDAPAISSFIMDFSYVLLLVSLIAAFFELNMIINDNQTSDFFTVMLYGAVPTFLIMLAFFELLRFIISFLFLVFTLAYFVVYTLPGIKKTIKEVEEEELEETDASHENEKVIDEPPELE